jgi:ubiquinone/menaquinone biosynthesis C-methylase UbiE
MIEVASSLNDNSDSLSFYHATAEAIPVPDLSIDIVLSTMSFHHWSNQEEALGQIRNNLKPNGYFVLGDIFAAGILRPIFAPANHGKFNRIDVLQSMIESAGMKVVRNIPLRRYGGTIRIIISQKIS